MSGLEAFLHSFFRIHAPERHAMPVKRFLTLHGERFKERCFSIFEAFCRELVSYMKCNIDDLRSSQFMEEFRAQPALLTESIYINGFLGKAEGNDLQFHFALYGWQEAIGEALKGEYALGGASLWNAMTRRFPEMFQGDHPSTDEARMRASTRIVTKQYLEESWAKRNAPKLLTKLRELLPELLPPVLLTIISQYAISWIID